MIYRTNRGTLPSLVAALAAVFAPVVGSAAEDREPPLVVAGVLAPATASLIPSLALPPASAPAIDLRLPETIPEANPEAVPEMGEVPTDPGAAVPAAPPAESASLPAAPPDAEAAPVDLDAGASAEADPASATSEDAAADATLPEDAEPPPEAAEPPPALVGPDDDRILHEVEEHTTIAPAEPAAIRLEEPEYDIPLEVNAKVLDYVELFQTSRRRNFEAGLARSRKYEALMKPIFREVGVPTDLFYLALIESGYNPRAYSYAHAMGIWQFISSTGRLYGLRRTNWVDERCHPEKATRAAARHLRDLYEDLGSWPLVLAAYNAGQGRVERAIAKAGTRDFWSLELPAQTRNYVPAYYAALVIAKDPVSYGFEIEYEEAPAAETVEIGGGTRLSLVAALCETSVDAIKGLNPELRAATVPPGRGYTLSIPAGKTDALLAGLAKVPAGRATGGLSGYRVVPGDTLRAIAQRFGTSVEAIREANRLRGDFIRAGDRLAIPGLAAAAAPIPRAPGRVVAPSTVPASHRVRKGESPWSIAQRYGVALDDLLAMNGLDEGSTLAVGQTLALRDAGRGASRAARAEAGGTTYEVRPGDNLWQISRRFDTSVEELRRANGIRAGHTLQVGDLLTIP